MDHNEKLTKASIPYFLVEQKIDCNKKIQQKTIHQITLHENEITTHDRQFELDSVLDVSYRSFSNDKGLLYLHTDQGVFTYKVETQPDIFIINFHRMKESNI